ncbi:MAG: hypothetical protein LR001_05055 [Clostridiales bacterium]|nr:hypothetical protein [Clostridiales bacterium]
MKRKQFHKGIAQLAEEGSIQVYKRPNIGVEELIVGAVGALQLEVLEYRIKHEYGVDLIIERLPYRYIRWIEMDNFSPDSFSLTMDALLVENNKKDPILPSQNEWSIRRTVEERNKGVKLKEVSI